MVNEDKPKTRKAKLLVEIEYIPSDPIDSADTWLRNVFGETQKHIKELLDYNVQNVFDVEVED